MQNVVNLKQDMLPGYELLMEWFNTDYTAHQAISVMHENFVDHPDRYAGVFHGPDTANTLISIYAYHKNLVHIGVHTQAYMSNPKLAPAYWRLHASYADYFPVVEGYLLDEGWKTIAIMYNALKYAEEPFIVNEQFLELGYNVPWVEPIPDTRTRDKVSDMIQSMRIRIANMWAEGDSCNPLSCMLRNKNIAQLVMFISTGQPFHTAPYLYGTPDMWDLNVNLYATCDAIQMGSWYVGNFQLFPLFNGMVAMGAPKWPIACIPDEGDKAGKKWMMWWGKMGGWKNTHAPFQVSGDATCLYVLLFQHLLFEKGYSAADLSSGSEAIFNDTKSFLKVVDIKSVTGSIKIPNPRSARGPDNRDKEPTFVINQWNIGINTLKVPGRPPWRDWLSVGARGWPERSLLFT